MTTSPNVTVDTTEHSNDTNTTATDQSKIDELVLLYLTKRGYNKSVELLKNELNNDTTTKTELQPHKLSQSIHELAFNTTISLNTQILQNLIQYNTYDTSPDSIVYQYDSLVQWIQKCLTVYRNELECVMYPLYIHVYLYLIEYNYITIATVFLQRYKQSYQNKYFNELQHIQTITSRYELKRSELAQHYSLKKFDLHMSQYSYNLLISFLEERSCMFLLRLLNNYCAIKIVSKKPNFHNLTEFHATKSIYPRVQLNDTIRDYITTIQPIRDKTIHWGLLQDYAEIQNNVANQLLNTELNKLQQNTQRSAELQQLQSEHSALQAELNDDSTDKPTGRNKAKKIKEDHEIVHKIHEIEEQQQQEINTLKSSVTSHIPTVKHIVPRNDDTVPLPVLTEQEKHNITQNLLLRARLSSTHLPSIVQLSILNQSQQVTSITTNIDCTLCCVTLYNGTSRLYYLSTDKQPAVLTGHTGPVYKACFSPDSQYLLTCSADTTVRLYHIPTLTNPVVYKGHNYPIWNVMFSSLGFYFITVSHDKTARLWSTDKIYPLRIFVGHIADIECGVFHPNQLYVFTGSADTTIRMYDIHTGTCVRIYTGHNSAVLCIAVSPDGQYICSGSETGTIIVHHIESSKLICEWSTHTIQNTNIDISTAGITGQLPENNITIPHTQPVTSIVYSHDNTCIASTSLDGTVKLWSTKKYKAQQCSDALLQTYITHHTKCMYAAFTPRNLLVVAGVYTDTNV